ncbi:hypothetical protein ACIPSE_18045 [Streptomyces sp. NPDC090106]|uniref:hypothetical protein n=1 Tax=Streptomyces sp. NPDC090106 TaxID=3365946 RepID=UPI003824B981
MNTERPDKDGDGEVVDPETGTEETGGAAEAEAAHAESADTDAPTGTGTDDPSDADAGADDPSDAEDAQDGEVEAVGDGDGRDDGDRSVRRRSPVLVAAVAAAVLLAGGGGAYLATSATGGAGGRTASGSSGDSTPPPLHLDGHTGGEGGTVGIAPGEPDPNGVTYAASGKLPDGPDSAPVYRATGEVGEDEVARLAEALGVDGTPVLEGQAWTVGGQDAAGPGLRVDRKAPGAWTFHRYAAGTDACKSATVCAGDPVAPAGDPVSEAAAKKAAAPVLKAVGQADAKTDARQIMGAQRVVNADPVVGGLPTYGWTTGITVNAQGEVVGGSGQLKAPVKSDTYPVLDAEKTLARMNTVPAGSDHRMGIGGCASPVPLKDRLEAPCGTTTTSSSSPSAPARDTLTVGKAVFGLSSQFVDARQALVPSWLFEVRAAGAQDAFTVSYPAVDPRYIASAATASPSDEPTGSGSGSGDPTGSPTTRDVRVEGYTAEGDELTVRFTGGVCSTYEASAVEKAGEVTVEVTETSQPGKVCIMIAKVMHQTVRLDEPVGDREVVGTDGKEIPVEKAGSARLPETSGAR